MSADPLLAYLAIAAAARKKLRKAIGPSPHRSWSAILADMLPVESLLARTLRDGQLLAWLEGGTELLKALPEAKAPSPPGEAGDLPASSFTSEKRLRIPYATRPPLPPAPLFPDRPGDPPAPVRLPAIEKAARYLQNRLAYTPEEFAQLDDDAREVGFTVAKAVSLDAVEKVQAALAEDVAQGGTLRIFRARIREVIDESALSEAKVETLYRTHVSRAYSAGQLDVHDHPLVASQFPYVLYSATHDARVRPDHLAMEHLGMLLTDGSRGPVYRADDPVLRAHWPPWAWNCRCVCIFLSLADAASYGVREAIEWLRTGIPPANPEFVPDPGFSLPNGWVSVGRLRPII